MNPKIILAVVIAAMIGAFFIFDLQQYLNLEQLKQQRQALNDLYQANPFGIAVLFFIGYVAATAFALPVAAILTLAAGAIFGFWVGLVIVSFASTIGATIAFLFTRYLFHDSVEAKFGERLQAVNNGIEKDGAFYVFGLRLVPYIPFVAINSLLALTKLRTWTFYWASQIGMLLGTIVYVNAGTQLATIKSLSDIASPALLLSFLLLGIFPILAKQLLNWLKRRKAAA